MASTVTAQDWIEIRISSEVDAGELLGMLNDADVTGAWEEDGLVHLYWPADRWHADTLVQVKQAIKQLGGDASITIDRLPDRDWNEAWAKSVTPIRIGRRLVIRPSWQPVTRQPGDIELILDPKQAFGTGHHATTRLLLERLEHVIRGGERVLDIGTGSGLLAMAALRLGAGSAWGIDQDPVAIACAQDYAVENGFGPELVLTVATLREWAGNEKGRYDLILANLDRRTLLESADILARFLRTGARLLLCGILAEDRTTVTDAFLDTGAVLALRESEGWLALELIASEPCEGSA